MIFVTTATEAIYNLTGSNLIKSFIEYASEGNHLVFFFEDYEEPKRTTLPNWISREYFEKDNIHFVNLMSYEYRGKNLIESVEDNLRGKIDYTDEYSSPRSLKWFRPVASILYTSELFPNKQFCSIDADCEFIANVDSSIYKEILDPYNICYLGRKHFKIVQHGGWSNGKYVKTGEAQSTEKDSHTETGFIGFNCEMTGTKEFIIKNIEYWTDGKILDLKYKTDCHTFDATVEDMKHLKYYNMLESYGTTSPIGSRVLEVSPMGKYLMHDKGTLGPRLYQMNEV